MKPYIAKDKKDPGKIGIREPGPVFVVVPSNRELLIRICQKLGVSIE